MGLSGFLLLSLLERYFLQAMEESLLAQARITAQALMPGSRTEVFAVGVPSSAFNTVQQQNSSISLEAQNVAPLPEASLPGPVDLVYLSNASLQLNAQLETRIRIVDAQGTVLVDSRQQDRGSSLQADPLLAPWIARSHRQGSGTPQGRQALAGQYASRVVKAGRERVMDLMLPVRVDGALLGAVVLSQPLRDMAAVVNDLRTRWLLSTLVALLLSGGVGLVLSGAIARPLHRLTSAAGAVAQGRLDERVAVRSRDEVGRLSQAFNEMTARLQAGRQAQVDLVANVSHELRTPLTAIKGLTETLRDGAVDDPTVRDRFLETVEGETDRLIRLVNDLLLLSRADSEALNLQRRPVDITQLAQATAERLAPKTRASEMGVHIETSPDTPSAWADPDRVEQVLLNLLDNAIKYSRPGGLVTILLDSGPGGAVRVQVSDHGIGIPPEDLTRIGERFYRVDKARSRAASPAEVGNPRSAAGPCPRSVRSASLWNPVAMRSGRDSMRTTEGTVVRWPTRQGTQSEPKGGRARQERDRFPGGDRRECGLSREGGSGLGLAIAQALVQAHGGRLWVESQEGQGTCVTFTLPPA